MAAVDVTDPRHPDYQDQCGHCFNAKEQQANFPPEAVMKPIFDKMFGKKSMWCHQVTQDGGMAAFCAEREGKTFTTDGEVGPPPPSRPSVRRRPRCYSSQRPACPLCRVVGWSSLEASNLH